MFMDSQLQKLAATAIKQLQIENEQLSNELLIRKEAEALAFELFNNGSVIVEDVQSTIEKLASKSLSDLQLVKKAAELSKIANQNSLFKLSNKMSDNGTLDPLTRMLIEDL